MAHESGAEGTSSTPVNSDASESTIGINIKTLDSRTYHLRVNKNMPVRDLKEKIVTTVGVPLELQRLIYRGKVLNDDQLLSLHNMEDGDSLHLVVRQPVQSQPAPSAAADASRTNSNQANDPGLSGQGGQVGHLAHSVVLGTVNVTDRTGEAVAADISRIVGAVLNSLGGIPNRPTIFAANPPSSGPGAEGSPSTTTGQGHSVQESFSFPSHSSQSSAPFSHLPSVGSLNQHMVIPDALTTLTEFIDRLGLVLQSGNNSLNDRQHQPRSETSSLESSGSPTPEHLSLVMVRAQQLLSENAASALSHVSARLQRDGGTSDPGLRGQIQNEAMQLGVAIQHLGAMFLELGRVIMTLRMGQSPAESSVNSGPAVYISPAGPNPIMVQPFPFQASSLFGFPTPTSVPGLFSRGAPVGDSSRGINVHIRAESSISPVVSSHGVTSSGEAIQTEHRSVEQGRANLNGYSDSSSTRVASRTVVSATPARGAPEATGHLLSVIYPVHVRAQYSVPIHSAPVTSGSTPISGGLDERSFVPPTSAGSDSGATSVPPGNPISENTGTESSSNCALETTVNAQNSPLRSVAQDQDPSSKKETWEQLGTGDTCDLSHRENELSEVNPSGVDQKLSSTGENHPLVCSVSGNEGQQIQGYQPVSKESCQIVDGSSASNSTVSAIESSKREPDSVELQPPSSSNKVVGSTAPTPLGLGFGGLQPKKRGKTTKPKGNGVLLAETPSFNQNEQPHVRNSEAFVSLPCHDTNVSRQNANESSSQLPSLISQFMNSMPLEGQEGGAQTNIAGMLSNVMQSSTFNGLLSGLASSSGSSTGDLRGMLEHCVHSPAFQSTVNQLVRQVGQQDQGDSGQTQDRLNFAGMIQQMLPVVSQALGRATTSSTMQPVLPEFQPEPNNIICGTDLTKDGNSQVDFGEAIERMERDDDPRRIFRALIQIAHRLCGQETSFDIIELGNNEELANEFIDLLRRDIRRRVEDSSIQES
ncbi:hypothetical protein HPP92_026667 [Vanilla planifolia]|uniref:Ubiquitin-like domain-containing protein n=1 Tax=Vanilla planifolia TaxID=51239 RepID=A0A835VIY7_VANPL|nr:hypothetical protein HPP92_026667 [Vanilla planifolia]KAG0498803.1 hypothetical protein HPP92_003494 [Vanilla planifolia]